MKNKLKYAEVGRLTTQLSEEKPYDIEISFHYGGEKLTYEFPLHFNVDAQTSVSVKRG